MLQACEPLVRDALRVIQDVVTEAKGSPLGREEMRRVEETLQCIAGVDSARPADTAYSQREATILFADLRGFSAIAASCPTDVVLGALSHYLGLMAEIIVRHYGTIERFMGDGIMAVFHGERSAPRDHARRALLCAVEMQLAMNALRQHHRDETAPELYIGIGISTGSVMTGLVGSQAYRTYTVIGEEVNLAARIEAFSLRGQVLMSERTYEHCCDFVQAGEPIDVYVKGRKECLRIREAHGIPSLGKLVPRQDQRKSPRVAVALDVEYRPLSGKVVGDERLRGVMRDLSYYGARVELAGALPLYCEVDLAFDLPCLGFRADELYARVVSIRDEDGRPVAGLEFTSLDAETSSRIALFVQMRLQGECEEDAAPQISAARG